MRAPASRQHHWRLGLLMLMLLAGCVRAFVVVPTPTKQLGASRRPTLAPLPRTMDAAAASTTRAPVRRGAPLWIKGQPLEEEKVRFGANAEQALAT